MQVVSHVHRQPHTHAAVGVTMHAPKVGAPKGMEPTVVGLHHPNDGVDGYDCYSRFRQLGELIHIRELYDHILLVEYVQVCCCCIRVYMYGFILFYFNIKI